MTKIAIVITWFGENIQGGAEAQAYQIAKRLAARDIDVEVWTTCSKSFHDDWDQNYHPFGLQKENGIQVRRFSVDKRNANAFGSCVEKLLSFKSEELCPESAPISIKNEIIYWKNNISSQELIHYAIKNQKDFDALLVMPYLFPFAIHLALLLREKVWLQPCLHEEPYAYLRMVHHAFAACGKILINSDGEAKLLQNIFGDQVFAKSEVIYEGIEVKRDDLNTTNDALKISTKQLLQENYILYLGKKSHEKRVPFLIQCFENYLSKNRESNLKLYLAGAGSASFQSHHILDLGILDDLHKMHFLQQAKAVAIPSQNESFSRVLYEAWTMGSLPLVDDACLATKEAVLEARKDHPQSAGIISTNQSEWEKAIAYVDTNNKEALSKKAEEGTQFAMRVANWDSVIDRYQHLLKNIKKTSPTFEYQSLEELIIRLNPNESSWDDLQPHSKVLEEGYDYIIYTDSLNVAVFKKIESYFNGFKKTPKWIVLSPDLRPFLQVESKGTVQEIPINFKTAAMLIADKVIPCDNLPFVPKDRALNLDDHS